MMSFVKYIQGKKAILITILICSCMFFLLGYYYARKDVVVYEWNGQLEVYPSNWPTYNLPLAEYTCILGDLERGDTEEAKRRLEDFLESVIEAAYYRISVATPEQKKIINSLLIKY